MFVKANRGSLLISHIPIRGKFVAKALHLKDTRDNRREAKHLKMALEAALPAGSLEAEFAKRFPNSKHLVRLGLRPSLEPTLGEFAMHAWLPEKVNLTPSTHYDYECQLR